MKKILFTFISITFLALCLVGTAYSELPMEEENEKSYSKEESMENESILEVLSPDSAEAAEMEKEAGELNELENDDVLPSEELEMEKEDEGKETTIL